MYSRKVNSKCKDLEAQNASSIPGIVRIHISSSGLTEGETGRKLGQRVKTRSNGI